MQTKQPTTTQNALSCAFHNGLIAAILFTHFLSSLQNLNAQQFTRITTGDIVTDFGGTYCPSWGDYDNDGDLDMFVTNNENNLLYRNDGDPGGSGQTIFTRITTGAIVNDEGSSRSASWGDYDNDGDLDLFVANASENNFLYRNDGDPGGSGETIFTKITTGEIVNDGGNSWGASWGDYDNDGDLDLFVANFGDNFLYRNDGGPGSSGQVTFTRITTGDIVNDDGDSRCASWGDYDNDGDLDLFVANSFFGDDNFLYRNDGDPAGSGKTIFTKITTGAIVNDDGDSYGASWGDYDNDGDLDLFVANDWGNNFLYRNDSDPGGSGQTLFIRITTGDIVNDGRFSQGAGWGDFDNDGDLDLFVANTSEDNFLYRNDGDPGGSGETIFTKITTGDIVNNGGFSNGVSWGDYDNDGDLDLFVVNFENDFLYRNNDSGNSWINVRLAGVVSNVSAIGAKVRVKAVINGEPSWQLREISGQTGFTGQNSLNAEFGVGTATVVDSIIVEWPSGNQQRLANIELNQFLTITENNSRPVLANPILGAQLGTNGDIFQIDVEQNPAMFLDPDNDVLEYTATSSDTNVAVVEISTSILKISSRDEGEAIISVTADDGFGGITRTQFIVFVEAEFLRPEIQPLQTVSASLNQDLEITARITDADGIASAFLLYREAGKSNFTQTAMRLEDTLYVGTIPSEDISTRGLEYYLQATDNEGGATREPVLDEISIQVAFENPGISTPFIFPGDFQETGYRLFSIPFELVNDDPNFVLVDNLGEYSDTSWRFFELDSAQVYIEYPNTSGFIPGKAFWLHVVNAGNAVQVGAGRTNITSEPFKIPLHPGWNFIGNPFDFTIPLSHLSLKSGDAVELRAFEGAWNDPDSTQVEFIQSFAGYAIAVNDTTQDVLLVDPDLSRPRSALAKTGVPQKPTAAAVWSIRIHAQNSRASDYDNIAGVARNAAINWDRMDKAEPPVIGDFISLYFPHSEWQKPLKRYCRDFRPEPTVGETWDFEVRTNSTDEVLLTFKNIESVPGAFQVWLVDEAAGVARNLRERNQYSIAGRGAETPRALKLVVGKQGFVEERVAAYREIPQTFELSQNFPNPFNPSTTIRYGLPRAEKVTLKIYNILGEEIAVLVNDASKAAGHHAVVWDGRNPRGRIAASGVYFYQIRAGEFVQTRKMALIQ